jgi:hypothetical protein
MWAVCGSAAASTPSKNRKLAGTPVARVEEQRELLSDRERTRSERL